MKGTLKLVLILLFFGALPTVQLLGQSCFGLKLSSHTAEPGDTVCVEVSVTGFSNILGFQYSIQWNTANLQFLAPMNYNLPGLNLSSFGTPNPGTITSTWNDPSLQSVTLPDGSAIFFLCFRVVAPLNTAANIWFANTPTALEFLTNTLEEINEFVLIGSNIYVSQGNETPLSIESACVEAANCQIQAAFEATLDGGEGPPYFWSWNGAGTNTTTTTTINDALSQGLHHLTVTDGIGNSVRALVSTGSSSLDILDYTIQPVVCSEPGSISIEAVGGSTGSISYEWSTGATTSMITVTDPGNYQVTITDGVGCELHEDFFVPQTGSFFIDPDIYRPHCDGVATGRIELEIIPESGEYAFEWSTGATTMNLNDITAGTYSVTVTEIPAGCSTVRTFEVIATGLDIWLETNGCDTISDIVEIVAIPTNGNSPFTYLWSTGATTPSVSVPYVWGDVYSVTVTDEDGCSETVSRTLYCISGQATLNLAGAVLEVGESACVDLSVSNTRPSGYVEIRLYWDENILQFDSLTNLQMPATYQAAWASTPGYLDFSWINYQGPHMPVQTEPSLLMEVCFTALQPGSTPVVFGSGSRVKGETSAHPLLLFTTGSTMTVTGNSQRAIGVRAEHVVAGSNASACMEITVANFDNITGLEYDMTWDATKLRFDSITAVELPGLDATDFADFNQSLNGALRLEWQASSGENVSLPNGASIYEVCFTSIGTFPQPVVFSNGSAQNSNNLSPIVKTINGLVTGGNYAELEINHATVLNAGQDTCIVVRAENFPNILGFQFSMNWDSEILFLEGVTSMNLPGLSPGSFGLFPSQGRLSVSWSDPDVQGITLAPGTPLFSVCFTSTGVTGISPIIFSNNNTPIEFLDGNLEGIAFLGQGGFVIVPDQNVWPGDTDNNGHVNHFDLLPVGIGFGGAGLQRANATIDWIGQPAEDWTQYTPVSAINYKHIDTDGNGVIAYADTIAISQNWGLSVNPFLPDPPVFEPRELGVPLYVIADTLAPGEVTALDIVLGTNELPAENVYGIAFSITYNPELIVPGSVSASFLNSWLGEQSSDLIGIFRVSPTQDRIDIAITRTDGLNNSGNGAIGKLHITIEDVIFRNTFRRAEFGIENVRLIDRDELEIPVAPELSTSWVSVSTGTGNPELAQHIRLYPAPASDDLFVVGEGVQVQALQLLDQYGRIVANFDQPDQRMNISQLASGVYMAKITTDRGVAYKPVMVVH